MKVLSGIENELRAFANEVAGYVREHHNDVPKRSGEKWLVERQDGKRVLNQEDFAVPDYLFFLGHHLDEIQTLRSFEPIRRVLVSTELKHAFRPSGDDVVEIALFHYLAPLLARVLEAVDAGHTWDAALDARIRMLDDFLQKDTYVVVHSAPLLNFKSDSDDLELIEDIHVRTLSDETLERFVNIARLFQGVHQSSRLLEVEFQLESIAQVRRDGPYLSAPGASFQNSCDRLLKSFRLFRQGAVGIRFIGGTSLGPFGAEQVWMATSPGADRLVGEQYEFSASNCGEVVDILRKMYTLESDERFGLAMRRFMGSYEKPLDGDRLIDQWIALESLLMPDGTTELSYRVSIRGACLLGGRGGRGAIFDALRASYSERSRFVHGVPASVKPEVVVYTEDYLRRILRWCVESGQAPTKELLDSLVLGTAKA